MVTMGDDAFTRPPSGPEELFRTYHDYVLRIVRRTPAIPAQDAEDVASEIMCRLLERDVVGMFDPAKIFRYGDRDVPARFKTFLTGVVAQYVKGQRDRLGRLRKRELLIYDSPSAEDGPSWADIFGPSAEDDYGDLDAADWLREARRVISREQVTHRGSRRDLLVLLDELAAQVNQTGAISQEQLCEKFGISPGTASSWIAQLRKRLRQPDTGTGRLILPVRREIVEARPAAVARWQREMGQMNPALAGVTVAQARQAVKALRGVRGQPFVRQPLARVSSPLQYIDYHEIARRERASYPHIEIPAASHHRPAPHVLSAVIHHLERVISDAEAAAPA